MFVTDLPESRGIWIRRDALEHQRDRTVGERPVDDVGVSGDPADISGAPVMLAFLVIEHGMVKEELAQLEQVRTEGGQIVLMEVPSVNRPQEFSSCVAEKVRATFGQSGFGAS